MHPNLAAPEETHFYRWGEPFGTGAYTNVVTKNKILAQHRIKDGISDQDFNKIVASSNSRKDLYIRYMKVYCKINKPKATRWFDKTPQNVYGAALMVSEFPSSKLIHVVRNPLDVVSSLKVGKVMHIPQINGACNYWLEAVKIMGTIKRAYPRRVHEIKYEELTSNLDNSIESLLTYLGENYDPKIISDVKSEPRVHAYEKLFTEEEIAEIIKITGPIAKRYGYFS